MSRNKDKEFKEFLISTRKRVGPGLTNAPVWILQKAGKRIWNPKQKRHWKDVDLGKMFRSQEGKKKRALRKGRKKGMKKVGLERKKRTLRKIMKVKRKKRKAVRTKKK